MIQAKNFLLMSLILFIMLMSTYFYVVDQWVIQKRHIPFSYRQFIFEASHDFPNKVIVEGGSNAIHGIEPFMLANYMNSPVITIANNAEYPMRIKAFNLARFSRAGDIVLMPLEWNQYAFISSLTDNFVKALADKDLKLAFYYNDLPWLEKIRFVFSQYPLYAVKNGLMLHHDKKDIVVEDIKRLTEFSALFNQNILESFGNSSRNGPEQRVIPPENKTCDKYLFSRGFTISHVFKENLLLLKALKNKGVNIIFTWPTFVDHETTLCLADKNVLLQVKEYAQRIKKLIEENGFLFIGDFNQKHFSSECFLNTHYHIRHDCVRKSTDSLINSLQKNNISSVNKTISYQEVKQKFSAHINAYIKQQRKQLNEKLYLFLAEIKLDQKIDLAVKADLQHEISVLLSNGWYEREAMGVWSKDHLSELSLKISPRLKEKKFIRLTFYGSYFAGNETTLVEINGKTYGEHELLAKTFYIPQNAIKTNRIDVRLQHKKVLSPAELNLSVDQRKIKYALTAIEVGATDSKNSP